MEQLGAYMHGIARNLNFEILAVGGTANHIHVLIALPAKRPLSDTIRDLKANSSRWMAALDPRFAWQEGFGAFSVSPSQADTVKRYIRNQAAHHRKRSFEDEFVLLLKMCGVSYDSRYLFG
jgi:REP element-mobilizing transposase RayT